MFGGHAKNNKKLCCFGAFGLVVCKNQTYPFFA
jgi:hypothetical protein